jgi:2-keto-4-pentenoate hydratase/2-oxohepta-3-ene-1,7-dioic acid hydratase in catechol pathway
MKLVSYKVGPVATWGIASDGGVSDEQLRGGAKTLREHLDSLGAAPSAGVDHLWPEIELLPVIPNPMKIVCVGVNYVDHRDEANRPQVDYPTLFTRFADTQIGHEARVHMPAATTKFDYEGELAVVIGKPCHELAEIDALDVVAGYSCYNDFTARDWQRHSAQWTAGKNFPGTGAFGPWLVTRDEITDVAALHLTTTVNGEIRQEASLDDLIFNIPQLIAYISAFTPLAAGDVIVTGTPGGVGFFREPPQMLSVGDAVEVTISGIGTLRNVVC